ncbi:Arginine-hydroxylase NDUFAF5, mitochondrial [Halotydeus destructor]|nr:Arginine-hydroxylase NDUFAF5, mitochondrial [Halotydeus destructor]
MSKATKRKHVTQELVDNYELPKENQQIVKVVASRGNNLHEVEDANSEKFLVTMPVKFRRNVWIKRGNFIVVEEIEEGDKVKAEIVRILLKDHIRDLKKEGLWPTAFEETVEDSESESGNESGDSLQGNPNHPNITHSESDSSESEEESENKCSVSKSPNKSMNIFDRETKINQKEIAARRPDAELFDYLRDEFGYRLADRVFDIKRKFGVAVELGCHRGFVAQHLSSETVDNYFLCDTSATCLKTAKDPEDLKAVRLLVDEENLPFKDDFVDIFVSNLVLHWVNNLPGCLAKMMSCLKPDGVLIASMFGGQTLYELRCSLQLAETERKGGFAPHVSPFTEASDIGSLLTRAGYSMITVDSDEIVVSFPSMFELMNDLQGMGESNASWNRGTALNRDVLMAAAAIYKEMYGNENGSVPATFQIYNFIGWKPHDSQPKPMDRGSANFSLKDIKDLDKILKK